MIISGSRRLLTIIHRYSGRIKWKKSHWDEDNRIYTGRKSHNNCQYFTEKFQKKIIQPILSVRKCCLLAQFSTIFRFFSSHSNLVFSRTVLRHFLLVRSYHSRLESVWSSWEPDGQILWPAQMHFNHGSSWLPSERTVPWDHILRTACPNRIHLIGFRGQTGSRWSLFVHCFSPRQGHAISPPLTSPWCRARLILRMEIH